MLILPFFLSLKDLFFLVAMKFHVFSCHSLPNSFSEEFIFQMYAHFLITLYISKIVMITKMEWFGLILHLQATQKNLYLLQDTDGPLKIPLLPALFFFPLVYLGTDVKSKKKKILK